MFDKTPRNGPKVLWSTLNFLLSLSVFVYIMYAFDTWIIELNDLNTIQAFVSEYALIGDIQAKHGTLLGAVSEAGFLIGLERNRLIVA